MHKENSRGFRAHSAVLVHVFGQCLLPQSGLELHHGAVFHIGERLPICRPSIHETVGWTQNQTLLREAAAMEEVALRLFCGEHQQLSTLCR